MNDDRASSLQDVRVIAIGERVPRVDPDAWVAPGVTLIGDVMIGPGSSVYYGSVLRAERERIVIGAGSNVQDATVMHADPGLPVIVGDRVSIGHRALVHGAVVADGALIGMNATLLNGAKIGAGSLVAAGAVVREGQEIPAGVLAAGLPAKVRRELVESEHERVRVNAETYLEITELHRHARRVSG